MYITVKDIFAILNEIAPFALAEEWDNCGLQAGNFSWSVRKILVSLDVSMDVMLHAVASHADLVITHHPLMLFSPKSIDFSIMPGSAIAIAAAEKIAIISLHTNFDKVDGGLNDHFANMLGLKNLKPLIPSYKIPDNRQSYDHYKKPIDTAGKDGFGRIGELENSFSLREFALYVKNIFQLKTIRIIGSPELIVKQVALCTGSGGSLLKSFFISDANVYVTGDIKYHEAREIEQAGVGLIDIGHFASERIAVNILCEKLASAYSEKGINIEIEGYLKDADPFITLFENL